MLFYYNLNLQVYPRPGGSGNAPGAASDGGFDIDKDESDIQEMAEMFVIYMGTCNV